MFIWIMTDATVANKVTTDTVAVDSPTRVINTIPDDWRT